MGLGRINKMAYDKFRSEIVESYIEKYPQYGNRTIARIIFNDHPDHFLSVDLIRDMVKYRKGKSGPVKAKAIKNPRYAKSF